MSTEAAIFERKQREKNGRRRGRSAASRRQRKKRRTARRSARPTAPPARRRRGRRSKRRWQRRAPCGRRWTNSSLVQMDARRARLAREEAARAKAPAPAATPTEGGADGNAGGGSQQSAMAGGAGALPSSSVAAATGQNDTAWQQQQQQHQEAEEEEVVGGRPTQPISMPPAAFLQSAQPQTSRQPAKPQPRVGAEASPCACKRRSALVRGRQMPITTEREGGLRPKEWPGLMWHRCRHEHEAADEVEGRRGRERRSDAHRSLHGL